MLKVDTQIQTSLKWWTPYVKPIPPSLLSSISDLVYCLCSKKKAKRKETVRKGIQLIYPSGGGTLVRQWDWQGAMGVLHKANLLPNHTSLNHLLMDFIKITHFIPKYVAEGRAGNRQWGEVPSYLPRDAQNAGPKSKARNKASISPRVRAGQKRSFLSYSCTPKCSHLGSLEQQFSICSF